MPAAEDRGGRGHPGADREEAFAYWTALPREQRSYRAVAQRFGLSPRTVERYGREGGWAERLRAIETQARAAIDDRFAQERAEQLATVKKLIDATFVSYAQQLASGNVRHTPSGFVATVKLLLEQLDEQPASPNVPSEQPMPAQRSLEHKLAVLAALHQAGMFALVERALERELRRSDEEEGEGEQGAA